MRYTISVLAITFLVLSAVHAMAEPTEIARAGTWRGEKVPMTPAGEWWGIFQENDGCFLRPTKPSMVATPEDTGASTMGDKTLFLPDNDQPLIFVRGLKNSTEGPLRTAVESSDGSWVRDVKEMNRYINPGETLHLNLEGAEREDRVRLSALAEIREEPEFHQIMTYNYQLRLYQGLEDKTRSQTLFEHPMIRDLGHPHLEWAGDLDGDGKMDFLFDISDHYIQTHLVHRRERWRVCGQGGRMATQRLLRLALWTWWTLWTGWTTRTATRPPQVFCPLSPQRPQKHPSISSPCYHHHQAGDP